MAKKTLIDHTINITDDANLLNDKYNITPEISDLLDELYPEVQKGKKNTIRKLKKCCERYPQIPHFKNYLSAAYNAAGLRQKSKEVERQIREKHPDYLFGIVNHANAAIDDGHPEKVAEILRNSYDLKSLYPDRDTFHFK